MRIIDRYILRQYIQVFVICYLSLTGLYVVFDAFSNLDEFIHHAGTGRGLLQMMGEYYAYRSVFFFDRTSAVLAMIAAMFTVTWIQRHNELTALLAAGVPARRVVVPVIVAAVTISLVGTASRELLIPRIRDHLSRSPKDLGGDRAQELRPCYDHETNVLIRGQHTFANERRISKPNFLLPPELADWANEIAAADAYQRDAAVDRPAGYLLRGVERPTNLADKPTAMLGDRVVAITPRDADWLRADECFVPSDVTFDQLSGESRWKQMASTAELIRGLRNPSLDFGADVRVAIHARCVKPLLDVNLLFLGLPLILMRENRNLFIAIGMCIVVVCVFMMVVFGSQYLGSIYLIEPALAAWLPLMVFVPLAVAMSEPLRN